MQALGAEHSRNHASCCAHPELQEALAQAVHLSNSRLLQTFCNCNPTKNLIIVIIIIITRLFLPRGKVCLQTSCARKGC